MSKHLIIERGQQLWERNFREGETLKGRVSAVIKLRNVWESKSIGKPKLFSGVSYWD